MCFQCEKITNLYTRILILPPHITALHTTPNALHHLAWVHREVLEYVLITPHVVLDRLLVRKHLRMAHTHMCMYVYINEWGVRDAVENVD